MITFFWCMQFGPGRAASIFPTLVLVEGRDGERDRFPDTAAARMKKSTRPRTVTGSSSASRVESKQVLDGTRAADRCAMDSRGASSGTSRCATRSRNSAWPASNVNSSPQPFPFRVKRGHFEHGRPVGAAENRDIEFAPRFHVLGPDERKGDRFPDRISVRA